MIFVYMYLYIGYVSLLYFINVFYVYTKAYIVLHKL